MDILQALYSTGAWLNIADATIWTMIAIASLVMLVKGDDRVKEQLKPNLLGKSLYRIFRLLFLGFFGVAFWHTFQALNIDRDIYAIDVFTHLLLMMVLLWNIVFYKNKKNKGLKCGILTRLKSWKKRIGVWLFATASPS